MDNMLGLGIAIQMRDNFTKGSNSIRAGMKKLESSSDEMSQKVNKSLSSLKLGLASVGTGIAMLLPLKSAVGVAMDFEKQMSAVKSVMNPADADKYRESLKKLAMEMGSKTSFSATQAAQGMEELVKAGVKLDSIMNKNGLAGALDLAVAGELNLADAASIASDALNTFSKDGLNIRQAADILAGAANSSATNVQSLKFGMQSVGLVADGLGFSFKDTATALAVFAKNGLKGSDAGTSFKTMLQTLQPKTREAIDLFSKLGLVQTKVVEKLDPLTEKMKKEVETMGNVFFNANGKIKSMAEISGILNAKMKHLTDQQRMHYMGIMFGTDAIRAANILFKEGNGIMQENADLTLTVKNGITEMADAMSKITAANVAKERMNNFAGAMTEMSSVTETLQIKMGSLFLPTLTKIAKGINKIIASISNFIDTPLGKNIIYIAGTAGTLAISFGALIIVINLTRFASLQASSAFLSLGKQQVATAFATKGLIGGFKALARSIFTSIYTSLKGFNARLKKLAFNIFKAKLSTKSFSMRLKGLALSAKGVASSLFSLSKSALRFGLVIAPFTLMLGAVGGGFLLLHKGLQSFRKVLDGTAQPATGFLGFMQQIGGIVWSVIQIFKSWDGKTFNLGGAEAKLEALGILGTIKNLATWIVRIIEFGKGFAKGLGEAFTFVGNIVSSVYTWIVDNLNKFFDAMGMQDWIIGKNTSSIESWMQTGKILGYIVGGVLVAAFGSLAISVIAATWPILAIAGVVAGVIWLFSDWENNSKKLWTGIQWAIGKIWEGLIWLQGKALEFLGWFLESIPAWIGQALGWVVENVPRLIGQAFSFALGLVNRIITQFIPWLIGKFLEFGYWLITNLPSVLWNAFVAAITGLGSLLASFFQGIGTFFLEVGTAITQGIWDGIKSLWGELVDWLWDSLTYLSDQISGFFQGIWDGATYVADSIGSLVSGSEGEESQISEVKTSPSKFKWNTGSTISEKVSEQKAMNNNVFNPVINIPKQEAGNQEHLFKIFIGEEELFARVEKSNELKKARR